MANPKEWSWEQLLQEGHVEYRHGRLQRNYPLVQQGDVVVGYQSTPVKRVVALARVKQEFQSTEGRPPTILLEPLAEVPSGPTYDELLADPILSSSEAMRFRNQGTLFKPDRRRGRPDLLSRPRAESGAGECPRDGRRWRAGRRAADPRHLSPLLHLRGLHRGLSADRVEPRGSYPTARRRHLQRVCRAAQANPQKTYLVLVDEINRGNVAKILGELLTLLKYDKRGLAITLPQNKESFAVPDNVYLLGTMSTADRSIKLLDAALRRRFSFIELMPDLDLLSGAKVGELALDEFLEALNRRIAEAEGREKQIGHSYLLDGGQPISDPEEFASRFREEILPLLQEYCYDEYETLAKFIGTALVDGERRQLDDEQLADPEQLIATLASEFGAEDVAEE